MLEKQKNILQLVTTFKYLVANVTLFDFLFRRLVPIDTSSFPVILLDGVDRTWSGGVIVLELYWRDFC
jgi:hypothetical protein